MATLVTSRSGLNFERLEAAPVVQVMVVSKGEGKVGEIHRRLQDLVTSLGCWARKNRGCRMEVHSLRPESNMRPIFRGKWYRQNSKGLNGCYIVVTVIIVKLRLVETKLRIHGYYL